MSFGTWLWGTSQLDDAIDKATSELLPSGAEDIALNLEICDQIRSKSVPAKDAMRALKRRLNHKNPNVQLLALGLTDICIKNGGDHFLSEVASREFVDNLVSILKIAGLNVEVKTSILRMIQNWSIAFEGKATLSYVAQVYKTLQNEGFKFPPKDLIVANSAMVDTQTAPEWIDSDVCLRCRTAFSFTNRKHHCRNCGQVFDQQCSAKVMPLPHFGITQDVRVCDNCYPKLNKKSEKIDRGHRYSTSLHGTRHRSARELADAELQRAIQLSLQEVGSVNGHSRPGYVASQPPTWQYSEPPLVDRTTHPDSKTAASEEDDPDLKAAIEASLREANAPKPSAPIVVETPRSEEPSFMYQGPGYSQSYPPGVVPPLPSIPKLPNYDLEPLESDAILTFSQMVEQVQAQGGRDMSRYPAVNELYEKASRLRPKLALNLDDTGRKEQMLSDMHDKLSQAVKLYDQLLTEQVSHPRWRSSQPAATTSYQPDQSSYNTGYNAINGYNQWASPVTVTTPGPQQSMESPQQSSQVRYTSTPAHPQSPPADRRATLESSYSSQSSRTYDVHPSASYSQPVASSQHQWQQQQQPQVEAPQQPMQYAQQYSPTPAPVVPQFTQSQPLSPSEPQTPTQQQYFDPSQYQQYTGSTSTTTHLPPVPHNTAQASASNTYQTIAPPISLPQSPPPVLQYAISQRQPIASKSHAPTSYAVPPPSLSHTGSFVTRSNSVSHAPVHYQQPQPQSQPQQQQYQSPQPSLPQFPIAPTSAPQTFSMFTPSVPSVVPQVERKEALLIDL